MRVRMRSVTALAAALLLAVAGCGGDDDDNGSAGTGGGGGGGGQEGGTVTVLMGTAPDFLDPGLGYTTQSAEATWISYTPLVTYRHAEGAEGGELIPGLATDLPEVS